MPLKVWTARYRDHRISLHNHWSFVPGKSRGEWLEVDGKTVVSNRVSGWMDVGARLSCDLRLEGQELRLDGLIGWDHMRQRGQIFVNGERCGGDASMGGLEKDRLAKAVAHGMLRAVIVSGMLVVGLPFGSALGLVQYFQQGLTLEGLMIVIACWTVLYGGCMGAMTYSMQRRAYRRLYGDARV